MTRVADPEVNERLITVAGAALRGAVERGRATDPIAAAAIFMVAIEMATANPEGASRLLDRMGGRLRPRELAAEHLNEILGLSPERL